MDSSTLLSLVGAFITLFLALNAFFLRGIFMDLNDVKIRMAEIFENAKTKEETLKELKEDLKALEVRMRNVERCLK